MAAAFWLTYFLLSTGAKISSEIADSGGMAIRRGCVALAGFMLSVLALSIWSRTGHRSAAMRFAIGSMMVLTATVLMGMANYLAFYVVAPDRWVVIESITRHQTFGLLTYQYAETNMYFFALLPLIIGLVDVGNRLLISTATLQNQQRIAWASVRWFPEWERDDHALVSPVPAKPYLVAGSSSDRRGSDDTDPTGTKNTTDI